MVKERSRGMFGAVIDFSKAYVRIDQQQLWRVLEMKGVSGRTLPSLRQPMRR